jgi:hypothetical protein
MGFLSRLRPGRQSGTTASLTKLAKDRYGGGAAAAGPLRLDAGRPSLASSEASGDGDLKP